MYGFNLFITSSHHTMNTQRLTDLIVTQSKYMVYEENTVEQIRLDWGK